MWRSRPQQPSTLQLPWPRARWQEQYLKKCARSAWERPYGSAEYSWKLVTILHHILVHTPPSQNLTGVQCKISQGVSCRQLSLVPRTATVFATRRIRLAISSNKCLMTAFVENPLDQVA